MILHELEQLASRIERAYYRRLDRDVRGLDSRVWTVAAVRLLRLHRADSMFPIDPELFVASQPNRSATANPWFVLARASSIRRYRRRVRRIIRQLRGELRVEVRTFQGRLILGDSPEAALVPRGRRSLSPLGCFIAACRADRPDLAERFRNLAEAQHRSCPLYRFASRGMIPADEYPLPSEDCAHAPRLTRGQTPDKIPQFSLN